MAEKALLLRNSHRIVVLFLQKPKHWHFHRSNHSSLLEIQKIDNHEKQSFSIEKRVYIPGN